MFFDPDKMHFLNHKGKHFSVRGPLNVPRSPQGHPVIVQAGTSDDGMDSPPHFAEAIFSAASDDRYRPKAYYDDVKRRACGQVSAAIRIISRCCRA